MSELTGRRGIDVVYDPVGGDRFDVGIRCLAPAGRLLQRRKAVGKVILEVPPGADRG